jgi:hypothetical protein
MKQKVVWALLAVGLMIICRCSADAHEIEPEPDPDPDPDPYTGQDVTEIITDDRGIALLFPGDDGIEADPRVVFSENFETGTMDDLRVRWGYMSNSNGEVMSFSDDVPENSSGTRSLQMTATKGKNAGGELYKTFAPGWDTIYLRFYTKFAIDHGSHHHFVALRGFKDPATAPSGGAGQLAENHLSVTIEPAMSEINKYPGTTHAPPGIWQFYAYWPEMRSWQTVEGKPDGRPNPYYGNPFQPVIPAVTPRGDWICIEVMLKMNSIATRKNGELALWIDGKPVVHFAMGIPSGYWMRDRFRNDPLHANSAPFEGFRWRHDMDVRVNVLRLQHYVSGTAFETTNTYSVNNPDYLLNNEEATVWFSNVVMATEYIGTIR